ncbi:MAG: phage/plasmid primase, P4 family [Pseudomonadota bacterium]
MSKAASLLTDAALTDLARSGLDRKDAERLGMESVNKAQARALVDIARAGIKFPYHDARGETTDYCRVRFLNHGFAAQTVKPLRYAQPKGSVPHLYLPKGEPWAGYAADANLMLVITEGEKKAAKACKEGIPCIGIGGTSAFQAKKHGIFLLPDFDDFVQPGRRFVIVPDYPDFNTNLNVRRDVYTLAAQLIKRGVEPFILELQARGDVKVGLDDFLVEQGRAELAKRMNKITPVSQLDCLREIRFPSTDSGNAEFFAFLHGGEVAYDHARLDWLEFNGEWWERDTTSRIIIKARDAARLRRQVAASIPDREESERATAFAYQSENADRLTKALKLAQAHEPLADDGKTWDTNPMLMGVKNGVIDLRTGTLRPGQPNDRITMHTPIRFDPKATCPRWEQFLSEVLVVTDTSKPDRELIDFVWRAVGYSITGDTSEECLFLSLGTGANGKSKFLDVLRDIGGEYAWNTGFSTFEKSSSTGPRPSPELVNLKGRRIVTASETESGSSFNEGVLKAVTGRDPVTARPLYSNHEVTFVPTAKFWLGVNHRPRVKDDSWGFWRRVRLIPFRARFEGKTDDKRIIDKLRAELPGILAWAVRGCLEWQKRKLEPPKAVVEATADYREAEDPLTDFIAARCEVKPGAKVEAGVLWLAYATFEEARGTKRLITKRSFFERMETRVSVIKPKNVITYQGIGLREGGQGKGMKTVPSGRWGEKKW